MKANSEVAESKRRAALTQALDNCTELAEWAYEIADREMQVVRQNASGMQERFSEDFRDFASAVLPIKEGWEQFEKEMQQCVASEIENKVQELARKRSRLAKFTICIFGKTMAGKSTLIEALVQGDGSSIGKGGQNSTKTARSCLWHGLHILDTPGIGAPGAADFEAEARVWGRTSDVVVFVATSDKLGENEIIGLKMASTEVKPILFILNIKENLEENVYRKRFLQNPKSYLAGSDLEGHKQRLKKLVRKHLGTDAVQITPIHLQAAYMANTTCEDADALFQASGIAVFLDELREIIISTGKYIRLRTFLDGTIRDLMDLRNFYSTQEQRLKELEGKVIKSNRDLRFEWLKSKDCYLKDFIPEAVSKCRDVVRSELERILPERKDWNKKDLRTMWDSLCNGPKLTGSISYFKNTTLRRLERELIEPILSRDLSSVESTGELPKDATLVDTRKGLLASLNWNGIFGAIGNGFLASLARPAPPVFILNISSNTIGELIKQTRDYRDASDFRLQCAIDQNLDQLGQFIQQHLEEWLRDDVEKQMVRLFGNLDSAARFFRRSSRNLQRGAKSLDLIITRLNQHLVIKIAELNGLQISRSKLGEIQRNPGQTINITFKGYSDSPGLAGAIEKVLSEKVTITHQLS